MGTLGASLVFLYFATDGFRGPLYPKFRVTDQKFYQKVKDLPGFDSNFNPHQHPALGHKID